jgi:pantothenate kinase
MSSRSSASLLAPTPELLDQLRRLKDGKRKLIAVAGPPASGKSTLAETLCNSLNQEGVHAETVPMDGYHLDNRLLDARGLRARKGAPETFDVRGFVTLIERLKREDEVIYPVFDRERDLAIAGAGEVTRSCEFVIVEGNYLLFDEPVWSSLARLWDFSVWVETPLQVVLDRCIARWRAHGHSPEDAQLRSETNDLVNARRIMETRLRADMIIADHENLGNGA